MRKYCNEGTLPCPYLDYKRKPKCTKYKCRLSYCKTKTKGLGTITTIELVSICRTVFNSSCCDTVIDTNSHTCPGAESLVMFAENCCADCSWYKSNVN